MNLSGLSNENLFDAVHNFLTDELGVKLKIQSKLPIDLSGFVEKADIKSQKIDSLLSGIETAHYIGLLDNQNFELTGLPIEGDNLEDDQKELEEQEDDYPGLMIFALQAKKSFVSNRSNLSEITRVLNRISLQVPVLVILRYDDQFAFMLAERASYKQAWREGEKVGRVTMLKDVSYNNPHSAHRKIFEELKIQGDLTSVTDLYNFWQKKFSLETLNNQFYGELQDWFYFALEHIKLPKIPSYVKESEAKKNFLVRLIARTMFCWFIKEKGLIRRELLELSNWKDERYKLTNDLDEEDFLESNSYYRGILQNIFFKSLNQQDKSKLSDFKWTKYFHEKIDISWFTEIPYLNGGIFDELEEDNAKESIEDDVISIPNFLFYGKGDQKGLNQIFSSFKFTLEENTPFEEDIALDPELLGLMFENLLAEIDPNLKEDTRKSIRKLTGSYYTPRKIIQEMVSESLYIYLSKKFEEEGSEVDGYLELLSDLIYQNKLEANNQEFNRTVVQALDEYRVLDPACGSGAFPMGMLQRIVEILKHVDSNNNLWVEQKLQKVDPGYRDEFKRILSQHMDDYSRKLGIIRDSIYGIDIQPLAVQITKLRFFISLLIDQDVEKEISPMPNVETKIICADSLKNIQPDLFATDAVEKIEKARLEYYKPDLTEEEREEVAEEIVVELDKAFPSFSEEIVGKRIPGQNKALLKDWFTHATVAAPFFNMDFFFPELREHGGFDCVIGNPPYGGTSLKKDVCDSLSIQNKDPYGGFIARFLSSGSKVTPLKDEGVLAFIVSDTFMTIGTHLPLRKKLMDNYIHKMIRVHKDTFRATVNTAIIICERNEFSKSGGKFVQEFDENHYCQMADMSNVSIHEQYDRFIELLNLTKGVNLGNGENPRENTITTEFAIYYYPQTTIRQNSNLPFFIAERKMFEFQCDREKKLVEKATELPIYSYENKNLEMFRVGETYSGSGETKTWNKDGLFKIVSGIKTGGNSKYLTTDIEEERILPDNLAIKLSDKEKENGIKGDQYYVSFEKGKSSSADDGLLPCYFQEKSEVYIDWSSKGVSGMKNERSSDLANKEFRFLELENQISFSTTGVYAPTFRLSRDLIFLNKASRIFSENLDRNTWLGLFNSKLMRYFAKNFSNHTVEFGIEDLKRVLFVSNVSGISELVSNILEKQKSNLAYDYASNEQIEIDKLVYQSYGLDKDDVEEIEKWYARRYPKLVEAQKANLRKLGKSDDYLELYEYK